MARFEEALYDVFGPARADRGLGMSAYDPSFGEEELVAVQAQAPQLTGRIPIATGPTGVYGRLFADAGRRQAAQAGALGDLVSAARGRRMRERDEALIRKQREERAADEATRLQQARLRKNILAGFGEFGENVISYLGSDGFKAQRQKAKENREGRQALQKRLNEMQKPVDQSVSQMREIATSPLSASPALSSLSLSYSDNPVGTTAQDRMLSGINNRFLSDLSDLYGGR